MRIKVISAVAIIAALAIGVTASNASLRSEASVKVQVSKPGAPGKATITIDNSDSVNVPARVNSLVISSKVAKFNGKAVTQCKTAVPTNALGNNNAAEINPPCPKKSLVGKGTFVINTGIPGQPIPGDLGTLDGTFKLYNYKTSGGEQAAVLVEVLSQVPVPNAHVYIRAGVSKSGVITAAIPNTADLPPTISNLLRNPDASYRTTSLAKAKFTITSPRPARGKKPFFTLKNNKNLDFSIVLNRD
ncbi:MAG: hypothetical protein WAO61_07870 [Solirubrobacterales bacterium]